MTTTSTASSLLAFSNHLADLVEQTGRSVVAVNARRRRSSSGVYWQSGMVVTADHTVSRDEEITVTLPDNRSLPATLIGRDPGTDLAVLRLPETTLEPPAIDDTGNLKVGHLVLAIGRSSDSGINASLGVISALGGTWRTWQGGRIDQFIRPDLMLYPGFSGGPLVSSDGKLVGINTTGPRHMTLTIPASTVHRVVNQLLQAGRIARGYLGLGMQAVPLPDTLQRSLSLTTATGIIVVSVESGSPAEQAGILLGDILVALAGNSVSDVGDVHALLDADRIGQPLVARLVRGGALQELTITVGERPGEA